MIAKVDINTKGLKGTKLNTGEVHVVKVVIEETETFEKCYAVLSEFERQRSLSFKFEEATKQYVVNQGMIRLLLGRYLGMEISEVSVGRREKGKPFSLDDESLFFNTSNSGGLAVFAFSRDGEIGVDIEKVRPLDDLDEMIDVNFLPAERKFIRQFDDQKLVRFFRFWTIKEAYLKAIGEGMRLTPDSISFAIEKDGVKFLSERGVFDFTDWTIKEFTPAEGFVGTIVFKNSDAFISQEWYNELKL